MKQSLLLVLFSLIYFAAPAQRELKVLTYNIHHGYDAKERPRLDSVAAVIKRYEADITGLEEVDSVCDRSQHIDQPAYLGKQLGIQSVFVRHFPFQGGSYGLCLLSKFPVTNVQNIRLPLINNKMSSVALLAADILLPGKKRIKAIVVHCDYRDSSSRINQAHFIVDYCKNIHVPILLMGDFNALPDTREINIIKGSFHDVSEGKPYRTYPDDFPKEKIDFIFFRPGAKWKIKQSEVPDVHASDHLPLLAVLQYR